MSHYEREFPRDRDNRQYPPRYNSNPHDHPHPESRGRPNYQISRTLSSNAVPRDYSRPRDYSHPPREVINVPEFSREKLQHQKDVVLLATVPFDDIGTASHPLCDLLVRGVKNEENLLRSIEKLAAILENAGDFVASTPDATNAANVADKFRSDLDGRREFLDSLDGTLTDSIESFFKIPPHE